MLLFALLLLLSLPPDSESFAVHLSHTLKVKCDSLPHRSIYTNDQCFFAVFQEAEETNPTARCSSILHGAKAVDVPATIFKQMMVDGSNFHLGNKSKAKNFMCAYDSGYKCTAPETILRAGKCFIRASKRMNYVAANHFCKNRGMEIPAPANEQEIRIVRDVLDKGPVWVQKSLTRENGFKWNQVIGFSKWTTCEGPANASQQTMNAVSQNPKWSCDNDTASVIDQHGYWSNSGVENLMDVDCVKPAVNEFTAVEEEKASCNYHDNDAKQSAEQLTALPAWTPGDKNVPKQITCYTSNLSSTRYNVMAKATVETQRGCEVLCDKKEKCAGFSFKDAGFSSECILLSGPTSEKCASPTNVFLKKTVGCVARTNLTAEFGLDPCIDGLAESVFHVSRPTIRCYHNIAIEPFNDRKLIRAIDYNGRRITLMSGLGHLGHQLVPYEGIWMANYLNYNITTPIVAATCAIEGVDKCPCAPIKPITLHNARPIVPNRVNPCNSGGVLHVQIIGRAPFPSTFTPTTSILCRARTWIMHKHNTLFAIIASASCV